MIKSIQSLRAIAALCVTLYFCGKWFSDRYPSKFENPFELGSSGVDLFFIISGFIMLYSIHATPSMGARLFMVRRIIRIVPLYWIATTLSLSLPFMLPQIFKNFSIDTWYIAKSYLFIPQITAPLLTTGWTLVYEMYFYLVLAAFLYAGLRSKIYWVVVVFIISYLLGLFLPQYNVYPVFYRYTSEMLLEFVIGLLLFYVYHKGFRINVWVAAVLMAMGIALYSLLDGSMRLFSYGVPMACIFSGVIFCYRDLLNFKALHLMGDASYSLYLTQVFTIPACGILIRKLAIDVYAFSVPLLMFYFSAAIAVAMCSYFFLERPITNWLKKKLQGERTFREPEAVYQEP